MTYSAATTWATTRGNLLLAVTLEPREVGARLKAARERKGWTQLQFALEANVSPSSIARWEAGKLPPIRELVRVAELLNVDPAELVESPQQSERDDRATLLRELEKIQIQLEDAADDRRRLEQLIEELAARVARPGQSRRGG